MSEYWTGDEMFDECAKLSMKYFDQLMKLLLYQYKCQLMMVDALWKIEWSVVLISLIIVAMIIVDFTDDHALMDTGLMYWWICHTTIISLYYYYRYTSGNVDDTVILLDDTVVVFEDTVNDYYSSPSYFTWRFR